MLDQKTIDALKSARSALLDQILHEQKGEPRLFGVDLQKRIVQEINKVLEESDALQVKDATAVP